MDATITNKGSHHNGNVYYDNIENDHDDKDGDDDDDESHLGCDDHNKGVANLNENATNKNQKELRSTLMMMLMMILMMIMMTIMMTTMMTKMMIGETHHPKVGHDYAH